MKEREFFCTEQRVAFPPFGVSIRFGVLPLLIKQQHFDKRYRATDRVTDGVTDGLTDGATDVAIGIAMGVAMGVAMDVATD